MEKINLMNDYNTVAHPVVLDALRAAGEKRFPGYGKDEETAGAAAAVRRFIGGADADIHFMTGGTQTNLTAIGAFLRPHEAVISPISAHINIHETGSIEAVGHKILPIEPADGKVTPEDVNGIVAEHTDEHMVKPRLLFLSQATELGTTYSLAELHALRKVCDEHDLYLYIDGARLGAALTAKSCDMTPADIAGLADAFYIGGTKNGLLFGEALVICNPALRADFRYHIKQRGGLLAKGFLLGIQFEALLKHDLYLDLARHANELAARLKAGLLSAGYRLITDTDTNQIFPYVSDKILRILEERVLFERWGPAGENGTPIRFVTTWATTEEEILSVLELMRQG